MFFRTSAGLKPTGVCAEILPRLTHAIADLSGIVSEIRAIDGAVLTVSVAPIFASRWLIWRIQRFNELNPAISIRVVPTIEVVNLERSEVDIGIRVGEDSALGVGAIKLLDQRVFPVCSPSLARRISSPADLTRLPIIRENENLYGWDAWFSERGVPTPELRAGPTYADASLCLDAAITGQGIFMAWETLACDALERGLVVSPFRQRTLTGATYWFASTQNSARKPNVLKFRLWLEEELGCSVRHWQNMEKTED